ncbi:MAG: adenylate kinase [Dehalococcoidales bacterium]|nr:adenylate kinase [Dehalococcoidales bacterium]
MYIVFLGAPGAGKGTQAVKAGQALKLDHLATGDLFRQVQAQNTNTARLLRSYVEKGQLVPDDITIQTVLEQLNAYTGRGIIFDGFPRNLTQADALDNALAEREESLDKVVYIKVSEKELLSRLSGRWICQKCQTPYHNVTAPPKIQGKCDRCGGKLYQRADDAVETVKKRLDVYFAETAPLIDYYKRSGKLIEIDGEGSVDDVGRRIMDSLKTAGVV